MLLSQSRAHLPSGRVCLACTRLLVHGGAQSAGTADPPPARSPLPAVPCGRCYGPAPARLALSSSPPLHRGCQRSARPALFPEASLPPLTSCSQNSNYTYSECRSMKRVWFFSAFVMCSSLFEGRLLTFPSTSQHLALCWARSWPSLDTCC